MPSKKMFLFINCIPCFNRRLATLNILHFTMTNKEISRSFFYMGGNHNYSTKKIIKKRENDGLQ